VRRQWRKLTALALSDHQGPVIKKEVQRYYKRAFDEVVGPRYATSAPPPGVTKSATSGNTRPWST